MKTTKGGLISKRFFSLSQMLRIVCWLGLNRTGHMSGQDRTPEFAGQVLPDRTESELILLKFYLTSIGYQYL